MNLAELRANFKDILNRSDITDSQVSTFLNWGLRRVDRLLRTPLQREMAVAIVDQFWDGHIIVPESYVGMYWIKVNGRQINQVSATSEASLPLLGDPSEFYIENEKIFFRPNLKEGDQIAMNFFMEQSLGTDPTKSPAAALVIPDAVTYAALVFASDTFLDERKRDFKETFRELLAEIQMMSDRDELVQAVISNPYEGYY